MGCEKKPKTQTLDDFRNRLTDLRRELAKLSDDALLLVAAIGDMETTAEATALFGDASMFHTFVSKANHHVDNIFSDDDGDPYLC